MLITWKGIPPHETTWENCDDFARKLPHFHLEDKVSLERESNDRPPIVIQYRRRKTSGTARAQVMEVETTVSYMGGG